jgi:hypothetical protein
MPRRDLIQRPKVNSSSPVPAPTTELFENDLFPLKASQSSEAEHSSIDPKSMDVRAVLQLQRMIGNQAVMRLLQHPGATNTVQRNGGGSAVVVERPKPKSAVVAVTPASSSPPSGPSVGSGAPAPKAQAPVAEPEEELTIEQLEAELAELEARAAREDAVLEAAIAAMPEKQELSIEEELEQLEAEMRASGEMPSEPTPEDLEFAALEAEYDKNPDQDLGDVPLEIEDIDLEIATIKAELVASAAFSQEMSAYIATSSVAFQSAYKNYQDTMDGIDDIPDSDRAVYEAAADGYYEEVERQEAQIEEWQKLLLATKPNIEANQARLTELITQQEAIAPTRALTYGVRSKAKKAAKIAVSVAGMVAPVLKPVTIAIGIATDVVALVKTLRHIHNLNKLGRNKSMNPKTREALTYLMGKKKTKAGRRGAKVLQVGKPLKAYMGMKSLYKRAKGTKGKNREKFAKVLLTQARTGDADANAIILELVSKDNIREVMDPKTEGWKIIMDKMKSI